MTAIVTSSRPFEPGTTGWSIDDLNDPTIDQMWEQGSYEIIEGVLTTMPPAYYDGSLALQRLIRIIDRYLDRTETAGEFSTEPDLVLARNRVVRPDAAFLTPDDQRRQNEANAKHGKPALKYGRLLIPPTLVIEASSIGHEEHDRQTKTGWYADAGIPNYWILDPYGRTMICMALREHQYEIETSGKDNNVVRPALFPGLAISLDHLWA